MQENKIVVGKIHVYATFISLCDILFKKVFLIYDISDLLKNLI